MPVVYKGEKNLREIALEIAAKIAKVRGPKAGSHIRRKHKHKDVDTGEIGISTRIYAGAVFLNFLRHLG